MADPAEVIEGFLQRAGIEAASAGEGRWVAQLAGERKLTIPLSLSIHADTLHLESFFMRRPQENEAKFYEVLLRRNARAYGLGFALDGLGDVYLVGKRSLDGLDEREMDRIIGSLLIEADGMFDAMIEIGFATYLEADRRWRAANTQS